MPETTHDVAIIGAGMSGLAAALRLGMFGKRVILLERHNAPGGLNSFYAKAGRKYDVGLHAMTNWVPEGAKGTPLSKLLRQLFGYERVHLAPGASANVSFVVDSEAITHATLAATLHCLIPTARFAHN